MKKPLIEVKNLSKEFKVENKLLYALQNINLTLFEGEIFGLAGESGSGKSTLAKMLVNLLQPTEGHVFYKGIDIHQANKKEAFKLKKEIQFVFQNPSSALNPQMTVEEIIGEPLDIHKVIFGVERQKRILDLLDQVRLSKDLLHRLPSELSGGQKQRISIARSLALTSPVLILDEPLSSLDVFNQIQIIDLLKTLHREYRLTYFFISHDLSVMRHFCDRIGVMYLGEMVEIGSSDSLWNNPQHPYTQALLSAIPIPDPVLERKKQKIILQGELPSAYIKQRGCSFNSRCKYSQSICQQNKPKWTEVNQEQTVRCFLNKNSE